MKVESGTTIETDLKRVFKFIGSSERPAQPGLSVIKIAQSGFKTTFYSSSVT